MNTADHLHPRDGDSANMAGTQADHATAGHASVATLSQTNASVLVATASRFNSARRASAPFSRAASRGWLIALPVIAISSGIAYAVPMSSVPMSQATHVSMEAYRYAMLLPATATSAGYSQAGRDPYDFGTFGPGSHALLPNGRRSGLTPSALTGKTLASHRDATQLDGPVRRRSTRVTAPFALERVIIGAEVVEVESRPQSAPSTETHLSASVQPLRATSPMATSGSLVV